VSVGGWVRVYVCVCVCVDVTRTMVSSGVQQMEAKRERLSRGTNLHTYDIATGTAPLLAATT
jgi:hypothetical protein